MKQIILIFILCLTQVSATEIKQQYAQSKYCIGCHNEQGKDWVTSLHSKSHLTKNTLYLKILQYIEEEKFIYKEVEALRCGKCHNPRMDTKDIDLSYSISKAYGIEDDNSKKIDAILNNETNKEGISCIVCHNVDKINYKSENLSKTSKHKKYTLARGYEALTFGPSEIMVGPYKDSFRTTHHKMKQGTHFTKEVNTLCFACHYDSKNKKDVLTYSTGAEYEQSKSSEKCVDCHMGKYEKNIIAPRVISKVKAVLRNTRRHLFSGARNSNIIQDAINVTVKNKNNSLLISLENKTPHKVPTGFAGRELEIEIIYIKNNKPIKKIVKKLNTLYLDRRGNETISYIATELKYDTRLKTKETRKYKIQNITGSTSVQINIWYRLIKESLIPILDIEDQMFLKKYPIYKKRLKL